MNADKRAIVRSAAFAKLALVVCAICLFAGVLGECASLFAADAAALNAATALIRGEDMQREVNVLASDTLEGREAGSRGGRAAGAFLVDKLRKLKVSPAGLEGSYEQLFNNGYRNILAVLPGSDSKLKDEYVLVGVHYDHVGYGNQGNSLGPIGHIHNGADDNASGTAGLLTLVKAFASLPQAPPRSILFAFWDGEEKGLLGSEHWVSSPTVPLGRVKFAFNLDMIGRLREKRVEVYGVRTAPGLRRLLAEQNREDALSFDFNWDNLRDSDHYPFYQRKIPFLMPYTRKHDDYHRPSDDADKINHEGMELIVRVMFRTIDTIAEMPQMPRFREEATHETQYNQRQSSRPAPAEPSRLGVAWEAEAEKDGVIRLKRVDPGSPADAAGMTVGDRVLNFGGYQVDGTRNFRSLVMASVSPAEVVVARPEAKAPETETPEVEKAGTEKTVTLSVKLSGTPRKIGLTWRTDSAEPKCVIVSRVDPGSPAAEAGMEVNDRVHSVSGRKFDSGPAFRELISTGEQFDITFERGGHVRHTRITPLGAPENRPVAARKPMAKTRTESADVP